MAYSKELLLIVPTRDRPDNINTQRMSIRNCAGVRVCIAVDSDQTVRYLSTSGPLAWNSFYDVSPTNEPETMIEKLNRVAVEYGRAYDYIGFMGDDHMPRTVGWVERIKNAINAMGGGIVYCDDGIMGPELPTAVFMSSSIVTALGWMAPPVLMHLYCDNFWKRLGEELGCLAYLHDVLIEHMHPLAGKAESDTQYRRVNSQWMEGRDGHAWMRYQSDSLNDDVLKVKEAWIRATAN